MTALEFVAAGVVFARDVAGLRIHGPATKPELLSQLCFEIATRFDLVAVDKLRYVKIPWCCDVCGDQIGHDVKGRCSLCELRDPDGKALCRYVYGGMCELCVLARQKTLKEASG